DAVGNPVYEFDGKQGVSLGYDTLRVYPTSRTLKLGKSANLSWSLQWDEVIGRAQNVTAPDGSGDTFQYDDFGRPVSAAKDTLPAHLHYEYSWAGDLNGLHPKTVVWVFDGDTTELASGAQAWPNGSKWRPISHVMNGLMEPLYDSVASA